MNIAELFVRVSGDVSGLGRSMTEAQRMMQRAGARMQSAGRALTVGVTAPILAMGAAALGAVVRVGTLADELLDLADQTGLSTDTLQEFRHVARVAGVDSDVLATAAIKLTTALSGSGDESKQLEGAMGRLGVSVRDANGALIPMDRLFPSIIAGLQAQEDLTTRNALAADIFGRSWAELAPVLSLGAAGIADAREQARELGLVLSEDALAAADAFRIKWDTLKAVMGASASQIGVSLIPAMTALANLLTEFVPVLKALADAIGWLGARWMELNPSTQIFLATTLALAAALGPVLLLGGQLVVLFAALTPVTAATVAAFLAVVAAGAAIIDNWSILKYEAGLLIDKVQAIADKFKWLYDVTVGHSYVPDMVDGISREFGRMGGIFDDGLNAIASFAMGSGNAIGAFVEQAIKDLTRLLIKMAIVRGLQAIFAGSTGGLGGFVLGAIGAGGGGGAPAALGGSVNIFDALGPIPQPMSPNEAATHVWYRSLIQAGVKDNAERG